MRGCTIPLLYVTGLVTRLNDKLFFANSLFDYDVT